MDSTLMQLLLLINMTLGFGQRWGITSSHEESSSSGLLRSLVMGKSQRGCCKERVCSTYGMPWQTCRPRLGLKRETLLLERSSMTSSWKGSCSQRLWAALLASKTFKSTPQSGNSLLCALSMSQAIKSILSWDQKRRKVKTRIQHSVRFFSVKPCYSYYRGVETDYGISWTGLQGPHIWLCLLACDADGRHIFRYPRVMLKHRRLST